MGAKTAWYSVLAVLLSGVLLVQYSQYGVLREVARAMGNGTPGSNELRTSWKSGGVTRTVTTTRQVGESDVALLVRHTDEVKKELQDHPIDP